MKSFFRSNRVLIIIVAGWFVILAAFAIARHERLNSSAYDLAIKSQVIWNIHQGRFFASSIEVAHYLGDHVQFIMLLLAPLFGLWADVKIMLIVQALLLSLGAIPIYRISRRTLDDHKLALLFAAAYLLYPTIGFVNRFDFHPLTFVIFFLLTAVDFLETNRPKWASFFILLALICREDVGLTIFALGLFVAFVKKRRTLGVAWAGIGLAWSLVAFFVIIPTFRGGTSDTFFRYGWLGSNVPEMLETLVTRPGFVISHQLSDPLRQQFLIKLLLPLGFLSLLSPALLAITLPVLGYNLLSSVPSQSSIYFQYISPAVPFIFLAAIDGSRRLCAWLSGRVSPQKSLGFVAGLLVVGVILSWILDNPFTKSIGDPYFSVYALERFNDKDAFTTAEGLVPPDASVATMMGYAPHLSLRPELSLFYHRLWLEERPFGFPLADYTLLNLSDLRWGVNARLFYTAIETAIGHYGYEAIYYQNDVVLLKPGEEPQPETGTVLQRVIDLEERGGKYAPTAQSTLDMIGRQWVTHSLPETAVEQPIQFSSGIRLMGYELSETSSAAGRPLCVTLYWQTEDLIDKSYTVFIHFIDQSGYVHAQRDSIPALGFYPTSSWLPGELIGDMHCLQVPANLPPGDYRLNTGIYDSDSGARLQILSDVEGGEARSISLTTIPITLME